MRSYLSLLDACAHWRVLLVLIGLWAIVFGAILVSLTQLADISGGAGILDFEIGYSHDAVHALLSRYGETGFDLYRRIQWLDLINPALYTSILVIITRMVWPGRGPGWAFLLPLLGGIGDYAENATLALIVAQWPTPSENLIAVSSALSLAKNAGLAVALLPLLIAVVLRIKRR